MIFGGDNQNKEASWKHKYYDSLEQLELKEKQWSVLETALRNGMSTLSIAVEGVDKNLDQQLEVLRHANRRGVDGNKIVSLVRPITDTIERLEKKRKSGQQITPASVLGTLLDKLDLPRGTARQAKALRKLIDSYDNTDPKPVLNAFSTLLAESFVLASGNDIEEDSPPGILGRMFGVSSDAPKESDQPKHNETFSTEDLDSQLEHSKELFTLLLNKLLLSDKHQEEISGLQQHLKRVSTGQELRRLAKELALIINEIPLQNTGIEHASEAYSEFTINEILLQLLERLHFPPDFQQEVESLQQQLEEDVPEDSWPQILSRLAGMVASLRENMHREKKEIEEFLSELTTRLKELDDHIQGMESDRFDSYKNGQELNQTMENHVRGIETGVREAVDLGQLKLLVQKRLDDIGNHMEKFRELEEDRNKMSENRISALNDRLHIMEKESSELKVKIVKERKQALIDSLTEIANRMAYDERIEQEHIRWKRYKAPLSLVVIDIDFFKKVNDTYGHMAGDKVLQTLAKLIQKNIRETDLLTRYGGEEFVIIMPDTEIQAAMSVAEKLRTETERCAFHYRDTNVDITISCGASEFKGNDNPEIVFGRADKALYRAKAEGRNRCISS